MTGNLIRLRALGAEPPSPIGEGYIVRRISANVRKLRRLMEMEDGKELVVNTGQLSAPMKEFYDSITNTNATNWTVCT